MLVGNFYDSYASIRPNWQADALCSSMSVRPSIRPSVHCQTSEHDILKMNEPILMSVDINGSRVKGMKRSTLGVRRSKVKVKFTHARDKSGGLAEVSFRPLWSSSSSNCYMIFYSYMLLFNFLTSVLETILKPPLVKA